MATKARVLKLAISKDDSIDVAIWKLMADRKGRTASEIADALAAYGFDRTLTTTRAKALMRRGWFIRDEKQGKAITKYILKGNIEMPKQDNDKTQTSEGFQPTADELSQAPVIENREPALNHNPDVQMEMHPVAETKAEEDHDINPAEGVLTCIWKITHDFKNYSKEDVVVLLTAAGIGESTAKQKFAEAILKGWFIAHNEQIDGKEVKVFKLQERIEKPVDDKPYKARGPYNKASAPEVKQPDLVDQAQGNVEAQAALQRMSNDAKAMFDEPADDSGVVVTDAGIEKANEIISGNAINPLDEPMILKEKVARMFRPMFKLLEDGVEYSYDTIAGAIRDIHGKDVTEDDVQRIIIGLRNEGAISYSTDVSIKDTKFTRPATKGVLSSILQASGAPGPDRSQGESEVRMPSIDWWNITEDQVNDLEVALFTWVATWPLDTEEGIASEMIKQHFDEASVQDIMARNRQYFVVEFKNDVACFKLPYSMTRQTVTKERIANYKNEWHRKLREDLLDRKTTPTINEEESNMAKTQNEAANKDGVKPAPRVPRATAAVKAAQKAYDDATVVLWNLVLKNRNNEEQNVIDGFAAAIADEKLRKQVWDDNSRYFEVTTLAEVNYIKSPFDLDSVELTLKQINMYKEEQDKIDAPIDPVVLANITGYDGILRAMVLVLHDGRQRRFKKVENALRSKGFTGPEIKMVRDHLIKQKELTIVDAKDDIVKFDSDRKVPEPRFVIHQENGISFDPLNGMDYNLYLLLKDGKPRYMSEIVEVLMKTGFTQGRIQDRLLQVTGMQYNFLEMDNGENGMQFRYIAGGTEVAPKQVIQPDPTFESLHASNGLLYNIFRILTVKGKANFEAMVHRLITTGFDRVILKPLLDDMIERKVLIQVDEFGNYTLLPGAVEPKITTDLSALNRDMGLDLCLYKLLDDNNWTTAEFLVDVLARLGFDKGRAHDAIVKHSDKGGMLTEGVIGEHKVVRLSDGAKEPEVQKVEEERRVSGVEERRAPEPEAVATPQPTAAPTPAPSGLHAYERTSGTPEPKAAAAAAPLLEISIVVAGMHMSIAGAIQLYCELHDLGYGEIPLGRPLGGSKVIKSEHRINGRLMSDSDLRQLAVVLGQQIPPGPWRPQQEQQQGYGCVGAMGGGGRRFG